MWLQEEVLHSGERMKENPYEVVRMFERAVADYTGAPYAVSVDSCTNALFLCCMYEGVGENREHVVLPKRTYLSVPQAVMRAGGEPVFADIEWEGAYQLEPTKIWDAAKRFTSGMYKPGTHMCLSFHIKKILKISKGGMILTDDPEAVAWFKKARYEGRSEGVRYQDDDIDMLGWNMYMTPQQAAHGLALMQNMPEVNPDLPEDPPYRDLTEFKLFKDCHEID
jgi:dTDP-4-amino-4,6-dideoxygalactose transaminase